MSSTTRAFRSKRSTADSMENSLVIGSGPAGLTAALYLARAELSPLILDGPLPGGQLTQTTEIENFPGFPEAVNGFELIMAMRKQAERFGTRLQGDRAANIEGGNGEPFETTLASGDKITSKTIIFATGASPRWLGLESEKKLMNKGVSACATCDGAFHKNHEVVVVGGGDTAMEEAIFLARFASSVTIIHRRDQLRASKIMAERALNHPKISVAWNSVVVEITGEDAVEGVKIKNVETGDISEIRCQGYFAALGHIPATEILKGKVELDDAGYIVLRNDSPETEIKGLFAAGDCADHTYRQAITAAGMGCAAAISAERFLESSANG